MKVKKLLHYYTTSPVCSWISTQEEIRINVQVLYIWTEVLERLLRSNQPILKEISPEYSLEGLMLKLKLQYFDHLMWRTDSGKDPDAGKDWRQEEKGTTDDEMAGWHHWLDWHEFEQSLGTGDGQGSLACCSPWGRKELATTERLNWTSTWPKAPEVKWSCSVVFNSVTPWAVAYQAPPSMGFSRQEYWSRLPFSSPKAPEQKYKSQCVQAT